MFETVVPETLHTRSRRVFYETLPVSIALHAIAVAGRVHIDRREKLPLKVIEQGYPNYPDAARKQRLEDRVVVRYTIGTSGRVR